MLTGGYRFSRGSISGRGSVDKGHKIRDCRKSSAASSADHSLKENEGILDEKEEKGESAKGKKKEKSTSKKKEVMRYSLSGPTSYRRRGSAISGYEFGGSPGSYEIEDFELENQERNLANMKQHQRKVSSWIDYRLALSQQSSRFTLPMDMKQLETMTPVQYLLKHCVVSPRRANLYHKVFYRVKNNKTGLISVNDLEKGLKDVLIHTITEEHINELKDILKITEETVIDYKLFGGIAAFAERMLYHQFVTDETIDLPQFQKDKIECADFSALEWKLHGINIKPTMKQILNILGS